MEFDIHLQVGDDALELLTEVNGCQVSSFTWAQHQQLLGGGNTTKLIHFDLTGNIIMQHHRAHPYCNCTFAEMTV